MFVSENGLQFSSLVIYLSGFRRRVILSSENELEGILNFQLSQQVCKELTLSMKVKTTWPEVFFEGHILNDKFNPLKQMGLGMLSISA